MTRRARAAHSGRLNASLLHENTTRRLNTRLTVCHGSSQYTPHRLLLLQSEQSVQMHRNSLKCTETVSNAQKQSMRMQSMRMHALALTSDRSSHGI